jgi:hypothetical protein
MEWGNAYWFCLHTAAYAYSFIPTQVEKDNMRSFLTGFFKVLPCKECRDFINNIPEEVLNSKLELILFTVQIHDQINVKTGKKKFNMIDYIQYT